MRPSVFIAAITLVVAGALAHNRFQHVISMPGRPTPPVATVDPHEAFDAVFFEDADEALATLDGAGTTDSGLPPVIQSNPFID